jgi:hypothetical protein
VRVTGGTETALAQAAVPGLRVAAGQPLRVRLQVTGSSPTALRVKVWRATDPEPAAWLLQASDGTASLQVAGGLGLVSYLSSTATNAPVVVSFDDLRATAVP